MKLFVKCGSKYREAEVGEVAEVAHSYQLAEAVCTRMTCDKPLLVYQAIRAIAHLEHEVFGVCLLDNRKRLIGAEALFRGTLNGAAVYPREVVRHVMRSNAASVIFYHNHPSGTAEPSQADEMITKSLASALSMIDVEVLDHLIVGKACYTSFRERGLL